MKKRIYMVETTDMPTRLIKAGSASQAIRFVVKSAFSAHVPKMEEYGELLQAGITVEEVS